DEEVKDKYGKETELKDESYWCVDLREWRNEYLPIDSMEVYNGNVKIDYTGQVLDFIENDKLRVNFPNLSFSSETSITEVAKMFPNSAKLNRKAGFLWGGVVKVFTHKGEADRNFWLLEFRLERLTKMTFYEWFPRNQD
ncbi:MAG: hypothetical protein AAGF89_07480, partial [Bacteroidota bacterium]